MHVAPDRIPHDEAHVARRRLLDALVLLGILLRAWAYFGNPSLWLDEILLTRGIASQSVGALLAAPLPLDQVAPKGFLLVERLIVEVLGAHELSWRLLPFVVSIAAMLLFRRLAERVVVPHAVPFAVATFAIAIPLIRYAAETKQYGLDATATILLLLVALGLRDRELTARRLLAAAATGFGIVAFSQASVLVMAGIGVAFAVEWLITRDRRLARILAGTIAPWAVACVLATYVGKQSMTPSTRDFMQVFWAGGFLPLPVRSLADLAWFPRQLTSLFGDPQLMRYAWPGLFLGIAAVGLVVTYRRQRSTALMLAGPLVLVLAAAVAHQYPFRGRLIVFLVPLVLLLLAAGAGWLHALAKRLHPAAGVVALLALLAIPVRAIVREPPPYEIERHREVLAHLQANRRPGDQVLAFPLQRIGMLHYGPRYGLEPEDWTTLVCDREDLRVFLRDLDRFRGAPRLWLVSAGVPPQRLMRSTVRAYLTTIGTRRDSAGWSSLTFGDMTVERYDLSDADRLSRATAEDFAIPSLAGTPLPGCRPWVRPEARLP